MVLATWAESFSARSREARIRSGSTHLPGGWSSVRRSRSVSRRRKPARAEREIEVEVDERDQKSETEQATFHPGHVVSGIDFSNDPLLQGRLFSYIDTQIKRVGPNFAQIPINRPTCPVHNNQRDGEGQQRIPTGRVSYFPNAMASGCPMHSPEAVQAFSSYAEKMDGHKVRQRSPASPITSRRPRCSGTAWLTGKRSTSSMRSASS